MIFAACFAFCLGHSHKSISMLLERLGKCYPRYLHAVCNQMNANLYWFIANSAASASIGSFKDSVLFSLFEVPKFKSNGIPR